MDGKQQHQPLLPQPEKALHSKMELNREFIDILPKDLKAVISEVAASGVSLKLPWVEDAKTESHSFGVPKQIPLFHRKTTSRNFSSSSGAIVRHKRPRTSGRIGHAGSMARMRPYNIGASNTATATVSMAPTTTVPLGQASKTTTTLLSTRILQHPQQDAAPQLTNGRRLIDHGRKRAISQSGSTLPSGSEAEDLSQYECDSESTSVTSVSELSFDLGRGSRDHWNNAGPLRKIGTERLEDSHVHVFVGQPKPRSLRDAFRIAVDLILESFYQKRGYKPSPAEKRKHSTAIANEAKIVRAPEGRSLSRQSSALSERELMMQESIISFDGGGKALALSEDEIQKLQKTSFCHRKEKILSFLDDPLATDPITRGQPLMQSREPPFTLQRIAEILEDPERYYSQTHKLCNSLEKLLLVSTTVADFGGWYGGEEESIRSLAEDKDSPRHRSSSVTKWAPREQQESPSSTKAVVHGNLLKPIKHSEEEEREEVYDAATRASLRAKFDHTGFDPHLAGALKIPDGRPSSPPPPNHGNAPTIQIPIMPGGFLRSHSSPHGSPTSPDGMVRFPSAFSFQHAAGHTRSSPVQNHGIQNAPGSFGSAFSALPAHQLLLPNHAPAVASRESEATNVAERDVDMESKSPVSSSDADDSDVSFDDSASDRSDGSDAGQPDSTASLAAALSRAHQRLQQQNRILSQIQGEGYTDRSSASQAPRNGPNERSTDSAPGRDTL